ncbi:hypothetical protein GCM10022419_028210 [Nonomuraea rosea]|uniref:HTH luxR-type domain-containing protein n=1 Tax=Nonomuraea rosea TaxID=638574 RepID=A0ABP6W5D0_9ACTN
MLRLLDLGERLRGVFRSDVHDGSLSTFLTGKYFLLSKPSSRDPGAGRDRAGQPGRQRIKGYVSRLLDKLGCDNRTQAGLIAHDAGVVSS